MASGVRRIEALTGSGAMALRRERQRLSLEIQNELGTQGDRVPLEIRSLKQRLKDQEKELADLRRQLVAGDQSSSEAVEVQGVAVMAREVPSAHRNSFGNSLIPCEIVSAPEWWFWVVLEKRKWLLW